jgi:hypothetical protein
MQELFEDPEIIGVYTRKQAISDGALVDMTVEPFGRLAQDAGLKWPIAMTFNRVWEIRGGNRRTWSPIA